MEKMENYIKEVSENKKKNNKYLKSIGIYLIIVIFTIIINIFMYSYVSCYFIVDIGDYLSKNIPFLYIKRPIIFFDGVPKLFARDFMLNIFLLLIIEFGIVYLFRKRLNKFFKIENLFTIKKIMLLAGIIIVIQIIFSCYLWFL
jgi:hypothetical protein